MATDFNFGLQLVKMVGSLALVLAVIAIAAYGLKRLGWRGGKPETNSWIEVVARYPVGIKQQILLVKVKNQLLLLGVSPQGVQFLTHVSERSEPSSGVTQ